MRERLAGLSPERRALLEQHLLRAAPAAREGIARGPDDTAIPLSFAQQRLWFLEQLAPGRPTYNTALAMRATGPLDVARLEQAVRAVIERHEAVRTVFSTMPDGTPTQRALSRWRFAIDVRDLRHLAIAQREAQMLAEAGSESRRPFDLERDLMLRVSVFRMGEADHVVLLVEHHIAFDAWSEEQLFRELGELYDAAATDRRPVLDELAIRYADWAAWQREQLHGERLERLESYWRAALAGAPPLLRLPLDHARPPLQTFAGAHHRVRLPSHVGRAARRLACKHAATPFMVLVATFAAALRRWSGETDIVLGSPIASRDRVEVEHLIGLFSNTFVLRIRVEDDPSLDELVQRTREVAVGAYEHQALPFERLVETLRPPRDPSHNPIFQVNVRVLSEPSPPLRLRNVAIGPIDLDVGFSRFDLALELQVHDDDRLSGYLEYNRALFEDATARTFAARFERLAADGLARPDVAIGALDWESETPGAMIRGRRAVRIDEPGDRSSRHG